MCLKDTLMGRSGFAFVRIARLSFLLGIEVRSGCGIGTVGKKESFVVSISMSSS